MSSKKKKRHIKERTVVSESLGARIVIVNRKVVIAGLIRANNVNHAGENMYIHTSRPNLMDQKLRKMSIGIKNVFK